MDGDGPKDAMCATAARLEAELLKPAGAQMSSKAPDTGHGTAVFPG